jgi:glucose-1-phosphate thymidylyltransferase
MKALILAAGYATRLYPLTRQYPKPLLEVNKKPIIDYIIDQLNDLKQVDEIIVVSNDRFISKFGKWAKTAKTNKKITLVNDLTKNNQSRLGAIGDINFVLSRKRISDDILVIGGDNLFSQGLEGFLKFSLENYPAPTMGIYRLKNKSDASRYGVVKLGRKGLISEFAEKPQKPASNLVAMCLYFIPRDLLGKVKEYMRDTRKKNDATGGFICWLKDKVKVYGFVFGGKWFDIGDHKYLDAANKSLAVKS